MRDDRLEGHEPLADRDEPVEALGHLHARESLLARLRVDREHAEREREPGDVRERLARARRRAASGPGRSRARSSASSLPQLLVGAVLDLRDLDPRRRERRAQLAPPEARLARGQLARRARGSRRAPGSRSSPSTERTPRPASSSSSRPATRTMKNSSRCWAKIAANLTRSRSGSDVVLGDLEDARVVLEPRELAVEEPRRRGSVRSPRPDGTRAARSVSNRLRRVERRVHDAARAVGGPSASTSERLEVGDQLLRLRHQHARLESAARDPALDGLDERAVLRADGVVEREVVRKPLLVDVGADEVVEEPVRPLRARAGRSGRSRGSAGRASR